VHDTDISPHHSFEFGPWGIFTCFYNHAHCLGLENPLNPELFRSFHGHFESLPDPSGRFIFVIAAQRFQKRNGRCVTVSFRSEMFIDVGAPVGLL
jgi:hypothetical protein